MRTEKILPSPCRGIVVLLLLLALAACGGGGSGANGSNPTPTATPCQAAENVRSNAGCHFWAVDLDNEAGALNDAAAGQFAVAVANANDYEVRVDVYKNTARRGEPVQEELVESRTITGNDSALVNLPQREVDGSMGQNGTYTRNSGSGTFASSHAYRIESNAPVVAHQFQPVAHQYSNDASTLFPRQALGTRYYVLGWPTANPCGLPLGDPLYLEGVPDHAAITIVGAFESTTVTVVPTHPIAASAGDSGIAIPATPAGGTLQITVGPYGVVNLESDQPQVPLTECVNYLDRDGDFTGTLVTSDKPVAVFSSLERAGGLGGATPPDPPGWGGETCCFDHLEQQMRPVETLGSRFVVSRSPVRSTDPNYEEPDLYRVLATANGTQVTTSLPAPYDRFSLDAGQHVTFHAYGGFTVTATGAIMLGQYLVSRDYIPQGSTGDPSFIVFPAVEQYRQEYVFLVPTTFQQNHMVLIMPETASVVIDGQPGFNPQCVERPIGLLGGATYKQVTCPLSAGAHRVKASEPVGLTVYGYSDASSYGYSGG